MNECPCDELTGGCGCECCTLAKPNKQPSLSQCTIPDERYCSCWSDTKIMQHSGIDPIAAMHSGGPFSRNQLIESWRLK